MPRGLSSEPSLAAPSPALAPPPGNPRFPLFDSLRAIAALGVVGCHTVAAYGAQRTTGWGKVVFDFSAGVPIFFVISGFLLYRPFVSARMTGREFRVRSYARRRLLRIIPGYWFALTVLALWPGGPWVTDVFTRRWWVYYGFGQVYRTHQHGLVVAWSLCTEMSFYIALPVYALLAGKVCRRIGLVRGELIALAVPAAGSLVVTGLRGAHAISFHVGETLVGTWYLFAIGMGLAVASVALKGREPSLAAFRFFVRRPEVGWLLGAGFLVLAALKFTPNVALNAPSWDRSAGQVLGEELLFASMAFLVVLPAVFGQERGGFVRRLLANRKLTWVGVISYGIYLWHAPLLFWLARANGASWSPTAPINHLIPHSLLVHPLVPGLILGVVGLAMTLVCATFSYYVVELPFLRLKEARLPNVLRTVAISVLRLGAPAEEEAVPDAPSSAGSAS